MNRLRAVMDATGSFTNFATEYLHEHKITTDFEVTPQVLDEFQVFLADRNIQPSVAEISLEQEFMKNRLGAQAVLHEVLLERISPTLGWMLRSARKTWNSSRIL